MSDSRSSSSLTKPPVVAASPMFAQWHEAKAEYPDCLLFFRMGDFYELFFDDAVAAAASLDIALTKRGEQDGDGLLDADGGDQGAGNAGDAAQLRGDVVHRGCSSLGGHPSQRADGRRVTAVGQSW